MNAARYEPTIVTTLRRYVRRGASRGLLRRLAGGAGHWRMLNQVYDLDGTASFQTAAPCAREIVLDDLLELTQAERRIAIEQIAGECAETGASFPSPHRLAGYFGCDPRSILNDLRWMRVSA